MYEIYDSAGIRVDTVVRLKARGVWKPGLLIHVYDAFSNTRIRTIDDFSQYMDEFLSSKLRDSGCYSVFALTSGYDIVRTTGAFITKEYFNSVPNGYIWVKNKDEDLVHFSVFEAYDKYCKHILT